MGVRKVSVSLKDVIAGLPPDEAKAVQTRSRELVEQELSLRALRSAKGETQATLAAKLGIKQENVSRIEQRADLLLSTLNGYLEALGGRLTLLAEFDGRAPIRLKGFATDDQASPAKDKTREQVAQQRDG